MAVSAILYLQTPPNVEMLCWQMIESLLTIGQNKGTIKARNLILSTASHQAGHLVFLRQKTMLEKAQCPEVIKSYEESP